MSQILEQCGHEPSPPAASGGGIGTSGGTLLVHDADRPRRLTPDGGIRVFERGEQRFQGPRVANRAECPRGLAADGDIAIGQERDERRHWRCDRAARRAPTRTARAPWRRVPQRRGQTARGAACREARRGPTPPVAAPARHVLQRRGDRPRRPCRAALRVPSGLLAHAASSSLRRATSGPSRVSRSAPRPQAACCRTAVRDPSGADERGDRARVAQRAERPGHLLADLALHNPSTRLDGGAGTARRDPARRRGAQAALPARPRRAMQGGQTGGGEARGSNRDQRRGRLLCRGAPCRCRRRGRPQFRFSSQGVVADRRRVVHQRDERLRSPRRRDRRAREDRRPPCWLARPGQPRRAPERDRGRCGPERRPPRRQAAPPRRPARER